MPLGCLCWSACGPAHMRITKFTELPDLLRGDELVVVNNSRVIPARLFGRRAGVHADSIGKRGLGGEEFLSSPIEVLLLRQTEPDTWEALVRPGRKIPVGERIFFPGSELEADVTRARRTWHRVYFTFGVQEAFGRRSKASAMAPCRPTFEEPTNLWIGRGTETVFAERPGSVAAPTAGLHSHPSRSSPGCGSAAWRSARSRWKWAWEHFNRSTQKISMITGSILRLTRSLSEAAAAIAGARQSLAGES